MNKQLKPIPAFQSEDEEREFWSNHSSSDYIDWQNAKRMRFPNLKPSTEVISLRLPLSVLNRIKLEAHKRGLPYQSFLKQKLYELFEG
jgi:predicted DNA binding CopG/RHH family protein